MYDGGKIIAGLVVFLLLITLPLWYSAVAGDSSHVPDPMIVTDETECVAPADYMKAFHMDLLDQWRDEVVRDADRIHVAPNGVKYEKSLSKTCMNCHSNKADFCDQCHNYTGVDPYCWDCHIEPEETQ